eukprot:13907734-Alexandrium_andersonii.AAC.1
MIDGARSGLDCNAYLSIDLLPSCSQLSLQRQCHHHPGSLRKDNLGVLRMTSDEKAAACRDGDDDPLAGSQLS